MKPTKEEILAVIEEENQALIAFTEAINEETIIRNKVQMCRQRFNDARDAKRALTNDLLAL